MINKVDSRRPILRSNLFFLIMLVMSIILPRFLAPILYIKLGMSQPVALISSHFILFVLPAIIYILVTRQSFKTVLRLNKVGYKEVLLSFVLAFLAQPVMAFFSYIASFFANNDVAVMLDTLSKTPLWLMVLMIGVTPAISEEITMRGIVLSGYKFKSKHVAAVMSGVMFGILHLNLHQFLYAFVMGIIFGYLVMATNSLIPAMIAHFTINTSQLLLQRALVSMQEVAGQVVNLENATQSLQSIPLATKIGMGLFYAVFAIGAGYLIMLIIKYMEKLKNKDLKRVELETLESTRAVEMERIINIPFILIIIVYVLVMFIQIK